MHLNQMFRNYCCVILGVSTCLFKIDSYGQTNVILNPPQGVKPKYEVKNQTLVSVGQETYTSIDLASLWEMQKIMGNLKNSKFDFLSLSPLPIKKFKSLSHNVFLWPREIQVILFVLLSSSESVKLNLFNASKMEALKSIADLKSKWPVRPLELLPADHPLLEDFWIRTHIAKQYLEYKGNLLKNQNLLQMEWQWHNVEVVP